MRVGVWVCLGVCTWWVKGWVGWVLGVCVVVVGAWWWVLGGGGGCLVMVGAWWLPSVAAAVECKPCCAAVVPTSWCVTVVGGTLGYGGSCRCLARSCCAGRLMWCGVTVFCTLANPAGATMLCSARGVCSGVRAPHLHGSSMVSYSAVDRIGPMVGLCFGTAAHCCLGGHLYVCL